MTRTRSWPSGSTAVPSTSSTTRSPRTASTPSSSSSRASRPRSPTRTSTSSASSPTATSSSRTRCSPALCLRTGLWAARASTSSASTPTARSSSTGTSSRSCPRPRLTATPRSDSRESARHLRDGPRGRPPLAARPVSRPLHAPRPCLPATVVEAVVFFDQPLKLRNPPVLELNRRGVNQIDDVVRRGSHVHRQVLTSANLRARVVEDDDARYRNRLFAAVQEPLELVGRLIELHTRRTTCRVRDPALFDLVAP